jgi:hypothetical protein
MAINRDKPTTRQPTFSVEEANKLIAEVAASRELLLQQKMELDALKAEAAKPATNGKSEVSTKNDLAAVRAFKKAGYSNNVPHQTIMTFNRWVAAGFRPLEGSKSLKINGLRLFHRDQCRPITAAEKKASAEQVKAAEGRKPKGKVVPIHREASPQ